MGRITDNTTYPITVPAAGDSLLGVDVSDTSLNPDGRAVKFSIGSLFGTDAADMPIPAGVWKPYNRTLYGGSEDGVVWDHSSAGSASVVTFPDLSGFEEAKILIEGFNTNTRGVNVQYKDSLGAWTTVFSLAPSASMGGVVYALNAPEPGEAEVRAARTSTVTGTNPNFVGEEIVAIRFVSDAGTFTGGVLKMKTRKIVPT